MTYLIFTVAFQIFSIPVLGITVAAVIANGDISASTAGFVLSFAGTIAFKVNRLINDFRSLELEGVSLERTKEYRDLEREDYQRGATDGHERPRSEMEAEGERVERTAWPKEGRIEVKDMSARYAPDLPDVLHGLSFTAEVGMRVGIVGASGGG